MFESLWICHIFAYHLSATASLGEEEKCSELAIGALLLMVAVVYRLLIFFWADLIIAYRTSRNSRYGPLAITLNNPRRMIPVSQRITEGTPHLSIHP